MDDYKLTGLTAFRAQSKRRVKVLDRLKQNITVNHRCAMGKDEDMAIQFDILVASYTVVIEAERHLFQYLQERINEAGETR